MRALLRDCDCPCQRIHCFPGRDYSEFTPARAKQPSSRGCPPCAGRHTGRRRRAVPDAPNPATDHGLIVKQIDRLTRRGFPESSSASLARPSRSWAKHPGTPRTVKSFALQAGLRPHSAGVQARTPLIRGASAPIIRQTNASTVRMSTLRRVRIEAGWRLSI
jgi:hypothetical protein